MNWDEVPDAGKKMFLTMLHREITACQQAIDFWSEPSHSTNKRVDEYGQQRIKESAERKKVYEAVRDRLQGRS